MDASVYERVDGIVEALVDEIGYAIGCAGMEEIVNGIMDTIVNAVVGTFGGAAVNAVVDALVHVIGG